VGLEKVAAGCPNLTSLNLSHCKNLTDVGLEKVVVGCPKLTSLNLSNCVQVTDAGLEKLRQLVRA
jgi:hypothetical protein